MPYTHALVRPPASNFGDGLTSSNEGAPDITLALDQHRAYCHAIEVCGLEITELPADPRYPDGTFIEYAGLLSDAGYRARIEEKRQLAVAAGVPLIVLVPEDLIDLARALRLG